MSCAVVRVRNADGWARTLGVTAVLVGCEWSLGVCHATAAEAPLVFEKSMPIPGVPEAAYSDYMSMDYADKRLFATPQAAKAVAVIDIRNGRVLKMITGIGDPHGSFYSQKLRRLFVTDGAAGDVKVYSGDDYSLIKTIPLKRGADWIAYDRRSGLLYVNNGGEAAGMKHAVISVVDPVRMVKVANIAIVAPDLEASVLDPRKELLYDNLVDSSAVAVVDLRQRKVVATWKLPGGEHTPYSIALDGVRGRLYVACRDSVRGSAMNGTIFVLDTSNGRSVGALPIGGWADSMSIDRRRQRIYVSTGVGYIETYSIEAKSGYRRLHRVETALMAKTSLYSGRLDRLFVSVPHMNDTPAQVMVFKPQP